MCLMITFAFVVATLSFLSHGLIPQAIMSGVVAATSLSYFSLNIYRKRRCLFGRETDCNAK